MWNVNVASQQLEQQLEKFPLPSFVDCRKLSLLSSVKVSRLSSLFLFSTLSLFKIPDRVEHFIRGLSEGEGPKLSWKGVVWRVGQRVELGGEEPGEGGEDEVEHVLTDVNHDIVIQPKSIGNRVSVLI